MVNPTRDQLQRLAKGPENPMRAVNGRIVEMDSPAGAFECVRWAAYWDEEHFRWDDLVQRIRSAKGSHGLKALLDQSQKTRSMCGFYAAKILELAGTLYQRHGMDSSQVPASFGADTVWGGGLTPRQWTAEAAQLAEQNLADLRALGGEVNWGSFQSPKIGVADKTMGIGPLAPLAVSLLTWTFRAVVLVSAITTAIAVLDAVGFMALIFPNAAAARASYDLTLEGFEDMLNNCDRYEDPAEREACIQQVLEQIKELTEEANERAQENSIIPTLAVGGLGLGALAVVGVVGVLYLNTRKR